VAEKSRAILHTDPNDFFEQTGSVWMRLARETAKDVIAMCTDKRLFVGIVEGGIWQNPGFMSQLDAIWHSRLELPDDMDLIAQSNREAIEFIDTRAPVVDVVIVTVSRNTLNLSAEESAARTRR
jgi:hypothetical protein